MTPGSSLNPDPETDPEKPLSVADPTDRTKAFVPGSTGLNFFQDPDPNTLLPDDDKDGPTPLLGDDPDNDDDDDNNALLLILLVGLLLVAL
jgi:hypothetical protein